MRTLILLGLSSLVSISWTPFDSRGLPAASDCKERVLHAYTLLLQAQQARQREVAVVRFTAESVAVPPGQKDAKKTTSRFVLMNHQGRTYLSNGEVEIYQDGQYQVSVLRDQRLIMINSIDGANTAQTTPWLRIRDELLAYMQVAECKSLDGVSGSERSVRLVPIQSSGLVGKIKSAEYRLHTQTDALRSITVYYPAGSSVVSAAIVFQSQSWKSKDPAVDRPALRQVFGPDHKLIAAYQSFKVQDHR